MAIYDIDLWVNKTKDNALKIYNALEDFGLPFVIEPNDFLESNSVIQIGIEPCRIDILTDIDGLEFDKAYINSTEADFDGLSAKTLCIDDLIINKSSTNRPKDKLDLEQLRQLSKAKK